MPRILISFLLFLLLFLPKIASAHADFAKIVDGILALHTDADSKVDSAFRFLDSHIDTPEGFSEWEHLIETRFIPYAEKTKASDLTMAKLYYQLGVVQHAQGEGHYDDRAKPRKPSSNSPEAKHAAAQLSCGSLLPRLCSS